MPPLRRFAMVVITGSMLFGSPILAALHRTRLAFVRSHWWGSPTHSSGARTTIPEDVYETAIRWHVAQQTDDMDWTAYIAWLEADPTHRIAYDAIALLDADIDATIAKHHV